MIIGFGTRHTYDRIVEPFVKSDNGTFYPRFGDMVQPKEKTVWKSFDRDKWLKEKTPAAIMGCTRGTEYIVWDCKKNNIPYYYFDHAYIHKASGHRINPVVKTRIYRITKNAENYNKLINWRKDGELNRRVYKIFRQQKPNIDINYYRRHNGKNIVVLPPTEAMCNLYHYGSTDDWVEKTISEIKKHTDRNIIVKRKDDYNKSLHTLFRNAFCLVSSQTTAVIEAILKGVPSFCENISAALPISKTDLSQIETPHYPTNEELEDWYGSLLSCQYTIQEIHSGEAKRIIDRIQ